ncbi:unnamed protein product, partial [Closterium sp. NIES-53]
ATSASHAARAVVPVVSLMGGAYQDHGLSSLCTLHNLQGLARVRHPVPPPDQRGHHDVAPLRATVRQTPPTEPEKRGGGDHAAQSERRRAAGRASGCSSSGEPLLFSGEISAVLPNFSHGYGQVHFHAHPTHPLLQVEAAIQALNIALLKAQALALSELPTATDELIAVHIFLAILLTPCLICPPCFFSRYPLQVEAAIQALNIALLKARALALSELPTATDELIAVHIFLAILLTPLCVICPPCFFSRYPLQVEAAIQALNIALLKARALALSELTTATDELIAVHIFLAILLTPPCVICPPCFFSRYPLQVEAAIQALNIALLKARALALSELPTATDELIAVHIVLAILLAILPVRVVVGVEPSDVGGDGLRSSDADFEASQNGAAGSRSSGGGAKAEGGESALGRESERGGAKAGKGEKEGGGESAEGGETERGGVKAGGKDSAGEGEAERGGENEPGEQGGFKDALSDLAAGSGGEAAAGEEAEEVFEDALTEEELRKVSGREGGRGKGKKG